MQLVLAMGDTSLLLEKLEAQQRLDTIPPATLSSCAVAALQGMAWVVAARPTNPAVQVGLLPVFDKSMLLLSITLERTKLQPEQLAAALQPVAGGQAPGG
jgi:hypothetical protein